MGKRKKEPRWKRDPSPTREVRVAREPSDPQAGRPLWSFARVDHGGPFGWDRCLSRGDARDVADKLRAFEALTFAELGAQGSHSVSLAKLSKDARDRLGEIKLDDLDSLFSCRLTGKRRMWAIRDSSTLAILWWDPEHQVCPSLRA